MATIEYAKDTSISIDSGGTTVTREKMIFAASIQEIHDENLLPQKGSRHPNFSNLRLDSCSFTPTGNADGGVQGVCTATYKSKSTSFSSSGGKEKDPWDLGVQNLSSQPFVVQHPLLDIIDSASGKKTRLLNSAGCPIEATTDVYGIEYSFVFATKKRPPSPQNPVVNASFVRIGGELIPAFCGMLMPFSLSRIVDRDDSGKELRTYWEVSASIRCINGTWARKFLDVGTLARFPSVAGDGQDSGGGNPQPIYKYFNWASVEEDEKFTVRPSFGSLIHVIAAKAAYAKKISGSDTRTDKWRQAFNELPYEEVTEPLPLTATGEVFYNAMVDPINYPYLTKEGLEYDLADFEQYNIPTKLED